MMKWFQMSACMGFLLLIGVGCTGPFDAPYNAEIVEYDDLEFPWVACTVDSVTGELLQAGCQEPDPVIARLDFLVRDIDTLAGYNNVRVYVSSTYSGVYILPPEVIEAVRQPDTQGWNSIQQDEIWAEFNRSLDGDYAPTYAEVYTNGQGVATVFVWIQEMPVDETGLPLSSTLFVSIGTDFSIVLLTPSQ